MESSTSGLLRPPRKAWAVQLPDDMVKNTKTEGRTIGYGGRVSLKKVCSAEGAENSLFSSHMLRKYVHMGKRSSCLNVRSRNPD